MAVGLLLLFAGCAQVPKESVELSVTVGRDLAEVHRAHRELAIRYFGKIKKDINTFIDEIYRPYTIKTSLVNFKLIEKIEISQRPGTKYGTLTLLDVYVTKVTEEIASYRKILISPIETQESEVLSAIDDSYQKLQNANSIVTGHLASVRKVHEAQAEFLDRTGVEGLRDRFVENTVKLSDEVDSLIKKGRDAENNIDQLSKVIEKLKITVRMASEKMKNETEPLNKGDEDDQ